MNNKAQISAEYIIIISLLLIILLPSITGIINQHEKNTILYSAQIGAREGVNKNQYAMYYNDTFNDYQKQHTKLLTPTKIEILEITMNQTTNNTIKLQIKAHTDKQLTKNELYILGSRINYYARKSITESFNKKANDIYYQPALSNNYIIETEDVKWI